MSLARNVGPLIAQRQYIIHPTCLVSGKLYQTNKSLSTARQGLISFAHGWLFNRENIKNVGREHTSVMHYSVLNSIKWNLYYWP